MGKDSGKHSMNREWCPLCDLFYEGEHECEEDTSDWPDDHKLDDPRRGQAQWINRERES